MGLDPPVPLPDDQAFGFFLFHFNARRIEHTQPQLMRNRKQKDRPKAASLQQSVRLLRRPLPSHPLRFILGGRPAPCGVKTHVSSKKPNKRCSNDTKLEE